jgi:hypothetical protein
MTEEFLPIDLLSEEIEALDRIARTYDGLLLHRFLRRALEAVYELQTDSALRAGEGRRSLARDLMRHMARGIEGQTSAARDSSIIARTGSTTGTRTGGRGPARRVPVTDPYAEPFTDAGSV